MTTLNTLLGVMEQKLLTLRSTTERLVGYLQQDPLEHTVERGQELAKAVIAAANAYFDATRFDYNLTHRQAGAAEVAQYDKARAENEDSVTPPPGFRLATEDDLLCLPLAALRKAKKFTGSEWLPSHNCGTFISNEELRHFHYAVPIQRVVNFQPGGE